MELRKKDAGIAVFSALEMYHEAMQAQDKRVYNLTKPELGVAYTLNQLLDFASYGIVIEKFEIIEQEIICHYTHLVRNEKRAYTTNIETLINLLKTK